MTRPYEDDVLDYLQKSASWHGETHGGRILAGLAAGDPDEIELGSMLLASIMQQNDHRFLDYLRDAPVGQIIVSSNDEPEERPVYERPNGDIYYGRDWNGYWDVEVLKSARDIHQFPLLQGPPGTGKTAMAESAFGDELLTIVINAETTTGELVGSFIPDGEGEYMWADGPLLTAVKEGRPILLDEILLGDPKMLSVLYPLMDGRNFLSVSENPTIGIVPAEKGFFAIGTGNPNVPGAKMSEALSSRFPLQVEVTTDYDLLTSLGADQKVITFSETLSTRASGTSPTITWAPQFREILSFQKIEAQWGKLFAVQNLLRMCPRRDLDEVRTVARTVWSDLKVAPARI
ncbi:AAA-ATPase [Microbacterium phage Big4]|nr:AAA-ATPase [Microbacterium phage Big4]